MRSNHEGYRDVSGPEDGDYQPVIEISDSAGYRALPVFHVLEENTPGLYSRVLIVAFRMEEKGPFVTVTSDGRASFSSGNWFKK